MAMFKPEVMKKVSDDWVVDSLVVYLKSSMWRTPVDKFIKQNCTGELLYIYIFLKLPSRKNHTVFDSEEENKFLYTDIHKNYKKLVSCSIILDWDGCSLVTRRSWPPFSKQCSWMYCTCITSMRCN